MFRVLTVAREYGSGGGPIAHRVAEKLGGICWTRRWWRPSPGLRRWTPVWRGGIDERCDSWLHRISRRGLWQGGFEGVASPADAEVFDAETMAALGKSLIVEAHSQGDCVIVGRGAQCVLQDRDDVLHVFVYAPRPSAWRVFGCACHRRPNIEQLMRSTDQQRADFIRLYFGCDWKNLAPVSHADQLGARRRDVAETIVDAIGRGGGPCAVKNAELWPSRRVEVK